MKILGIDTSTLTASVALLDDQRVLASHSDVAKKHSDTLLLLVDQCLRESGLLPDAIDLVAVGAGPGSFTGLRIGLATAKGLCFALSRPIVLPSSLAALAARAPQDGRRVVALTDAHKAEVYAGRFTSTAPLPTADGDEAVYPPELLVEQLTRLAHEGPLALVGDGVARYPALAVPGAVVVDTQPPGAVEIARLGQARFVARGADELGSCRPHYIRLSEAELVKLRRQNGL